MKNKLIFIREFGNLPFEAFPLIRYFEKKRFDCYEFKYEKCLGQISLKKLAQNFDDFVKKIKGDFVLVGLSQGGIIGAYWLEFLKGKKKCKKIVTICSPFHGSYLAHLLSFEGIKELRPGSKFLYNLRKRIKKSNVKYYCIWNPLDLIVIPGSSGKLDYAYKNKRVIAPFHSFTFWKKATKETIEEII